MSIEVTEMLIRSACAIGGFIVSAIPGAIGFFTAKKSKKLAKNEADKKAAENDMITHINSLIADAEQLYKGVDAALKQQGQSAGPMKKDSVMSKLQSYALDKGYKFDLEFWSNKIDEIISMTKQVNSHNN